MAEMKKRLVPAREAELNRNKEGKIRDQEINLDESNFGCLWLKLRCRENPRSSFRICLTLVLSSELDG